MALSRVKTWIAGEILTASDQNSEFNNILSNAISLISPLTAALDADGKELILDADGDTSITADTDDQIDIKIAGSDDFKFAANLFDVLSGSTLNVNAGATHKVAGVQTLTKGADVTAATDLLVNIDGNFFDVAGATTIATVATKGIGTHIVLQFDSTPQITHDATNLILPGGANITAAAGDIMGLYEYASADWRCEFYTKASGLPVVVDIVNDTTPQLGGDLDLNGKNIDFPTTANISDCLDEDDLTSDSATMLATQQSIKAYVDSNLFTRGAIDGLILSNDSDADHDIAIAPGVARDDGDAVNMTNSATLTKQLDAPWAVGDDAGGLDAAQIDGAQTVTFTDNGGSDDFVTIDSGTWSTTPSVGDTMIVTTGTNAGTYQITTATSTQLDVATASFTGDSTSASAIRHIKINTWYHLWLIRRSDTGVVDVLFSDSATAPTMPTNYDQKRRIGAVLTDGSANILGFSQDGDEFLWDDPPLDIDLDDTLGTTARTDVVSVPTGLKVQALLTAWSLDSSAYTVYISSLDVDDEAPSTTGAPLGTLRAFSNTSAIDEFTKRTNTSAQIRSRASLTMNEFLLVTRGWIDPRGRNA